jgi:hypothetical protein
VQIAAEEIGDSCGIHRIPVAHHSLLVACHLAPVLLATPPTFTKRALAAGQLRTGVIDGNVFLFFNLELFCELDHQ